MFCNVIAFDIFCFELHRGAMRQGGVTYFISILTWSCRWDQVHYCNFKRSCHISFILSKSVWVIGFELLFMKLLLFHFLHFFSPFTSKNLHFQKTHNAWTLSLTLYGRSHSIKNLLVLFQINNSLRSVTPCSIDVFHLTITLLIIGWKFIILLQTWNSNIVCTRKWP